MGTLTSRLADINQALDQACAEAKRSREDVTLVAVSKRQPDALVLEAYECGVRDFGENTLQGFEARRAWANAQGLNDIRWHFIGQIQSRKAKALWGQVSVIHTLDRVKLLKSVGEEQVQAQSALVQVNVGEEPQKGECCPLTWRKCSRLVQSLGRSQAALCVSRPTTVNLRTGFSCSSSLRKT